ncbi:MAG: hypothetical protein NBV65_02065 [Burkholderiaceae bacterium]|nr:hypothetical protein [Burkholderiaceae bacterium]
MTDEADRSDEKIAAAIEDGISRIRRAVAHPYTGECYFCGEELSDPMRFCDTFCRDDWDAMQRAKRRSGE